MSLCFEYCLTSVLGHPAIGGFFVGKCYSYQSFVVNHGKVWATCTPFQHNSFWAGVVVLRQVYARWLRVFCDFRVNLGTGGQ